MEEILGETYGVMSFQEQVMRILNRLGGIELSSAYACIKAISKKKQDIIDQRRADFLKGAQERGVSAATAQEIFDLITYFGGYGFNASHSAAYAHLGYQTAYLKTHYTPEFMAALLSSEIEDGNKRDILVQHIEDARRLGVKVLPPDVNAGDVTFTVADGQILFGLTAIKGLGRGAAEEIVRVRTKGDPYRDLFDFCERVDHKLVSRAAIERLIKAGAFDRFGPRAPLMHVLPRALQAAGELQEDRRHGQLNFFDAVETDAAAPDPAAGLPDIPEWPDSEKLKYEKEALDFYVTSHPLAQYEEVVSMFSSHRVEQVAGLGANQEVIIGGMLTDVRFLNTKKARNGNSRYLRCKLEDLTGSVECVMWPDDFVRYKDEAEDGRVCFVRGVVERTRETPGLVLSRILSLEQAQRELTRGLVLRLRVDDHGPEVIEVLAGLLRRAPGACPVFLNVLDTAGRRTLLKAGEDFRINPATLPTGELETLLGPGGVRFSGLVTGNGNGKKTAAGEG
jgi:DNA polymerase-3 subunit alpha